MPVSLPSASRTARTLRLCRSVRRAMSSASSSIENAGLDAPDVRLGQNELVERDIARGAERDLLNGCSHFGSLRDGRREPLSLPNRHKKLRLPLPLLEIVGLEDRGRRKAAFRKHGPIVTPPRPRWSSHWRRRVRRGRAGTPADSRTPSSRAGGADDGAVVLAQHLQPGTEVVRVAHGRHDAERRAYEGARHFRDQLLARIGFRAIGTGQVAGEARLVSNPMGFMPISA